MTNFREVRERVTAEDAARRYGLDVDRHGKALCPFHADRHPSMSFKNGRYRCWVCNVGGDSIDLTARLLGLSPIQACKRLNTDFALALPIDAPPTKAEHIRANRRRVDVDTFREFETWRETTIGQLNDVCRLAHLSLKHTKPENWTEAMQLAVKFQPTVEHWSDLLSSEDLEKQIEVFRNRQEVTALCLRILRSTLPK